MGSSDPPHEVCNLWEVFGPFEPRHPDGIVQGFILRLPALYSCILLNPSPRGEYAYYYADKKPLDSWDLSNIRSTLWKMHPAFA